jgi:hypothetical protein
MVVSTATEEDMSMDVEDGRMRMTVEVGLTSGGNGTDGIVIITGLLQSLLA